MCMWQIKFDLIWFDLMHLASGICNLQNYTDWPNGGAASFVGWQHVYCCLVFSGIDYFLLDTQFVWYLRNIITADYDLYSEVCPEDRPLITQVSYWNQAVPFATNRFPSVIFDCYTGLALEPLLITSWSKFYKVFLIQVNVILCYQAFWWNVRYVF